jgi:hypothetical protein
MSAPLLMAFARMGATPNVPDERSLLIAMKASVALGYFGWQRRTPSHQLARSSDMARQANGLLLVAMILFLNTMVALVFLVDPSLALSIGTHQPTGACDVTEMNVFGMKRFRNWCTTTNSSTQLLTERQQELFHLAARQSTAMTTEWYGIVGSDFGHRHGFVALMVSGCAIGALLLLGRLLTASVNDTEELQVVESPSSTTDNNNNNNNNNNNKQKRH